MRGYVLSTLLLAGCGGTVAHSEPISLKVGSIKASDLKGSAFDFDKEVSSESGNPYAAFLAAARAELDGEDPGAIEVDAVVLTVASDSKGIGTDGFGEVVESVEIYLAKSETTVVVGGRSDIPRSTTLEVPIHATEDELRVMYPHMLKGDFKVGVRGDAVATYPADFDLKTNVQITFRAIAP